MQPQGWKNLSFAILLVFSGANSCYIGVESAWAVNSCDSNCQDSNFAERQGTHDPGQRIQLKAINLNLQQSKLFNFTETKKIPSNLLLPKTIIAQAEPSPTTPAQPTPEPNPQPPDTPSDIQQPDEPPQLETQPRDFPQTAPTIIEELLDKPSTDRNERLQRLRQVLQERRQAKPETDGLRELDLRIRPRPLPQQPPSQIKKPVAKFRPIGSLQARVGYFYTDNIFSSETFSRADGLTFYGLRLASAYFPLGPKTYISGAIDGNLIRYIDQSRFSYNQIRFNVGIYQQLSRRMYGELAWNNQQFFYANSSDRFRAGDRFLNENSLRLSLGRRDPLAAKLNLDSFYEFSANFAEPDSRSRIINSFWVSLNYQLQDPLQVGLNYQLNLSDFTQRERHDQYHRVFGNVIYRVTNSSSLNLQSGIGFGDSTDANIDFDSWFLTIYYNFKLGEF
jgi:hypothetical protein